MNREARRAATLPLHRLPAQAQPVAPSWALRGMLASRRPTLQSRVRDLGTRALIIAWYILAGLFVAAAFFASCVAISVVG